MTLLARLGSIAVLSLPASAQVEQTTYFKQAVVGPGDQFGWAVAVDGDTLVVGVPSEDSGSSSINGNVNDNSASSAGAAYVFVWDGTNWQQQAYLKSFSSDANDDFGEHVAVSGDTVVVSAPRESSSAVGVNGDPTDNSEFATGAAYVFVRSGTTWSGQAYLKAAVTDSGDRLGESLDIEGDRIVIGAREEDGGTTGPLADPTDNSVSGSGAAYVFERNATSWTQTAYLKASNPGNLDRFGYAVSLSGDFIAVGAIGEDSAGTGVGAPQDDLGNSSGAVYVFELEGATWVEQAFIKAQIDVNPPFPQPALVFGIDLDLSGDHLVVGGSGYAEVLRHDGSSWSFLDSLEHLIQPAPSGFGGSVAIDGLRVALGASGDHAASEGINGEICDYGTPASGAVFLYEISGTSVDLDSHIKPNVTTTGDQFGISVSLAGDRLFAGAINEDGENAGINGNPMSGSAPNSGAVYEFDLDSQIVNPIQPTCQYFTDLCSGDGGNQMGCTDCPCSNNAAVGITGGCLNSAGSSATLLASGTPSNTLRDLRFEIDGLPAGVTAILTSGQAIAPNNPANPCFGKGSGVTAMQVDGLRCAVMNTVRHGARQSDANGEIGVTGPGWGEPDGFFNSVFALGTQRYFQAFYRDDDSQVCMTGQNTTQAVATTILP